MEAIHINVLAKQMDRKSFTEKKSGTTTVTVIRCTHVARRRSTAIMFASGEMSSNDTYT